MEFLSFHIPFIVLIFLSISYLCLYSVEERLCMPANGYISNESIPSAFREHTNIILGEVCEDLVLLRFAFSRLMECLFIICVLADIFWFTIPITMPMFIVYFLFLLGTCFFFFVGQVFNSHYMKVLNRSENMDLPDSLHKDMISVSIRYKALEFSSYTLCVLLIIFPILSLFSYLL